MEKFKTQKKNNGFTLIELMVATSIFMVIMLVAMGSLVVTSDSAKKAQTLNFTMDNLSFAMESMSRSLRMGTNYYCSDSISTLPPLGTADCSGRSGIAFTPAKGNPSTDIIAYFRDKRDDGTFTIKRYDSKLGEANIISENINIEELKFFVKGSSTGDTVQPSVYMMIRGSVLIKGEEISFSTQTMISQRTLD